MNQDLTDKIEKLIPIELHKDYYSKYDVLALSVKLTDKYEFSNAFDMRNIAEEIYINEKLKGDEDDAFVPLEKAVITHIFYNEMRYDGENYLYDPIKYYISELIENSVIVEHKIINRKRPDIFLSVNNELCVGEVKPKNFTNEDVNQLRTYIQTYGARVGYAFGLNLTGILDNNMIFINISGIKDRFYKDN